MHVRHFQVTALPPAPVPLAVYFVKPASGRVSQWVTDRDGHAYEVGRTRLIDTVNVIAALPDPNAADAPYMVLVRGETVLGDGTAGPYFRTETAAGSHVYVWTPLAQTATPAVPALPITVLAETAAAVIAGHRVVAGTASGVAHADVTTLAGAEAILGISLNAAIVGADVSVQTNGRLTFSGWSWASAPVFAGSAGALVQPAPTTGFMRQVGFAIAPTTLVVDIRPTVKLS